MTKEEILNRISLEKHNKLFNELISFEERCLILEESLEIMINDNNTLFPSHKMVEFAAFSVERKRQNPFNHTLMITDLFKEWNSDNVDVQKIDMLGYSKDDYIELKDHIIAACGIPEDVLSTPLDKN